jgi:hypothetical protein
MVILSVIGPERTYIMQVLLHWTWKNLRELIV